MKIFLLIIFMILITACTQIDNQKNTTDEMEFGYHGVSIKWFGHASFEISGTKKIYIDPFVLPENVSKADYIAITHEHFDHCSQNVKEIQKNNTRIFSTINCLKNFSGLINSLDEGEFFSYEDGFKIKAVAAYNKDKFKDNGEPYHPKGFGNGYILTIDGIKIYHAGDTDNIPEMKNLENIDIALLPIGGKFTMTVEEAAEAAKIIKPKVVIPMHYNSDRYGVTGINADPEKIKQLLADTGIEVKILSPLV